jgi:hypothetical protein
MSSATSAMNASSLRATLRLSRQREDDDAQRGGKAGVSVSRSSSIGRSAMTHRAKSSLAISIGPSPGRRARSAA